MRVASGPVAAGNVVVGDVSLHGACATYVRSESVKTAVIGLADVVVVAMPDPLLVAFAHALNAVRRWWSGLTAPSTGSSFAARLG